MAAGAGERVFHDCGSVGNPSHTGIDELLREYPPELVARMIAYHYESAGSAEQLAERGADVATPGQVFNLTNYWAPLTIVIVS
ncbi:MAG: hypothetical protein GKR94_01625 [Gammaproteobacteria bacterium]|nr:hypothetical protein [Gammaproteobacteria bacterium]